jgi:hypothetical protein
MGNYNFGVDLKVAGVTEKQVGQYLAENCGATSITYNHDNRYDLKMFMGDRFWTVEIKEDFMCAKTGNVAVEFESRGKPSGINSSQADMYIYVIHTAQGIKYLALHTKTLKRIITHGDYFRSVTGGDEGSETKSYLFKYSEFSKNGKFIM